MLSKSERAGITLVEMLTVVAIFTFILSLVLKSLVGSAEVWREGENEFREWQSATRTLSEMGRSLRGIKAGSLPGDIKLTSGNGYITRIDMRYWNQSAGWVDSWDDTSSLPAAIEISVHVKGDRELSTIVHIPAGRKL
jgi:type II secretory pathway pseudopilin PulG